MHTIGSTQKHGGVCVGKNVFLTFLDEEMHVTPALFAAGQTSLTQAHQAFSAHLMQAAGIPSAGVVLEIGGGWGALAMHALKDHDCKCALSSKKYVHVDHESAHA